ncbi:MAG: carboxylating nicotinate-nucleotide diphosphorylase [Bacillota bacterium]|nr:carboxylating nicotinate-nucleotide diphosphorylase [Bacillota bacterium]
MNWLVVDEIIKNALVEDGAYDDITTNSIMSKDDTCTVDLIAKEEGIIAGIEVFRRVFTLLGNVEVEFLVNEGDKVSYSQLIGKIKGSTKNVLTGERVALNLIQRMSGVATLTRKFADKLDGTKAKLLDTRKTTPGLRILEKYSVTVGGGCNHRYNLADGVLIKDNHIDAAGGITQAIEMARKSVSFVRKLEVEVESLEQLQEALEAKADIIMLDNMDLATMKKAVELTNGRAILEASGNVSLDTIRDIALTGVDYISSGSLTHSYTALDLSMKNLKRIDIYN